MSTTPRRMSATSGPRRPSVSSMTKKFSVASEHEHVDQEKHRDESGVLKRPANLAALSDGEYTRMGKKATLKMDLVIMPIMTTMYVLNYLDRQNIASARLAGIEEDLNLSTVEYQTVVSILFAGYILMQVPSNMIAAKVRLPGVYICSAMALWGLISGLMAVVQSFTTLLVCRFFLGFVEAVFFPGAIFFLSLFYNRQQFALRTAILYSGSQLGNAFGGLFAIAILNLDGAHGIAGWRWLFLVEGAMTIGLAIVFAFILPNSNKKIMGLSEIECEWVQWNFEKDLGQQDNSDEITAWQGLVMAVKDVKTWLLMSILYLCYIDGTVVNFFPSVVGTLGFDRNTTYALTAPPFILAVIAMIVIGFHSDKKQERYFHIVGPLVFTVIANIIAVSTLNTAGRYVAMMLLPASFYSSAVVILSWISGTLNQPKAKRAASIGLINSICNTPNIWGSFLYFGAPRYLPAFLVLLAASGAAIGMATVTRMYLVRQNKKMDRGEPVKNGPTQAQIQAGFRYML